MAIPINIEDLLNKRKIEGNRIEFKKGWNPADIYHCICAFANDFDNLGGGYILVGVEQHDNGLAKRPVVGINIEEVDGVLKQMVGFNNMFLIHIPVHAGCGNKPATEKTTEKRSMGSEKNDSSSGKNAVGSEKTMEKIVRLMKANPYITNKELAEVCGITEDGVYWNTKKLKKNNRIRRIGGDKGGYWELIEDNQE